MTRSNEKKVAAVVLVGATVAANAAFVGLGSSFDYPDVLQRPTGEILDMFLATQATTMAWFALLALGAALLAPAAILLSRQFEGRAARWSARVGVAAAVVQVIGLSRWFLLVPGYAARATDAALSAGERASALSAFETAHQVLGSWVGETLGYALTAAWTVLVLAMIRPAIGAAWFRLLGFGSAGLIALGVLIPLGVPGVDMANFVGYVVWSVWVVVLAAKLVRRHLPAPEAARA